MQTVFSSGIDLQEVDPAARASIAKNYGQLPLSFEVNMGQIDDSVRFLSRGNEYILYLTSTEMVLSLKHGFREEKQEGSKKDHKTSQYKPITSDVVWIRFIGSNPNPKITGIDELQGKSNYFIGNDPTKWQAYVSNFSKVKIEKVYPRIDLVYYGNQRQLEYDWIVAPGADPKIIRFEVESKGDLKIDSQGNLILDDKGEVRMNKPLIYQQRDGDITEIAGEYVVLSKREVGIQVSTYDTTLPLMIDPVLTYSTFLGGVVMTMELG
jgi:hypothetical protein